MSGQMFQNSPEAGMISTTDFLKIIMGLVNSTEGLPTVKKTVFTDEGKSVVTYYNIPAAFDIEVSSFYHNEEKQACMYVWQFGILNWVTYGRTWAEFLDFMDMLTTILSTNESKRLIVYIHNFAYEFQFIRRLFSWTKIFFLDKRKPVYGITGEPINGIEFRCSLKLSSKSLKAIFSNKFLFCLGFRFVLTNILNLLIRIALCFAASLIFRAADFVSDFNV